VLGRDPFASAADAAPGYVVSVQISGASAGWSALLVLRDAAGAVLGSRTVRARATLRFARRVARARARDGHRPLAPACGDHAARPGARARGEPAAGQRARHPVGLALRTGPGVAIGLLAPVTMGYHLALVATPAPALGVRFSLDAFPSDFAYDAGAAVQLRAATGSIDACLRLFGARAGSLSACAGGVLGAAVGTGQNLDVTRTGGGPIAGAEGAIVVRLAVGTEGFAELDAAVIGWIVRQDFGYLDSGIPRTLREMPVVTALVRLSLGWRLVP
jgi:hypothetical protein